MTVSIPELQREFAITDGFTTSLFNLRGDESSEAGSGVEYNNTIYFTARESFLRDWFKYDGQTVSPATELHTRSDGVPTSPKRPFIYQDKLHFFGLGDNGGGLFAFDGTTLAEVADIHPRAFSFVELEFFQDKVIMDGFRHPDIAYPVYAFDGEDVHLLSTLPLLDFVRNGESIGDYFVSYSFGRHPLTGELIPRMFSTDGVSLHELILPPPNDGEFVGPNWMTSFNGEAYFTWKGSNGIELFKTDGVDVQEINLEGDFESQGYADEAFGDHLVIGLATPDAVESRFMDKEGNINRFPFFGDQPVLINRAFELDDWFFLIAYPTGSFDERQLFKTQDFQEFVEVPGTGLQLQRRQDSFFETPDGLFFTAQGENGVELFWTDGETVQEFDIIPGDSGSRPQGRTFEYWEGAFYFETHNGPLYKLVRSDSVARVDYNRSGTVDVGDLDLQALQIQSEQNLETFDLTDDLLVNLDDRRVLVRDFARTTFGDSDLNGVFDSHDLVIAFRQGEYDDDLSLNSTWSDGDWNGDGEFDSGDLVVAFQDGNYQVGAGSIVPEPSSLLVFSLATLICVNRMRLGELRSCRRARFRSRRHGGRTRRREVVE